MRTLQLRFGVLGTLTLLACGGEPSAPPRPTPDAAPDRPLEASAGDAAPDLAPPDALQDAPGVDVPPPPPDVGMDGAPPEDAAGDVALDASPPEDAADAAIEVGTDVVVPADRPADAVPMDAPADGASVTCPMTTDCVACVGMPGCGMCTTGSTRVCLPGNGRGPTGGACSGRWTPPQEDGQCVFPPPPAGNILLPCTTRRTGPERDCGWTSTRGFTCTPGATLLIGSNPLSGGSGELCSMTMPGFFGSCSGNPVMRVCPGDYCFYASSLVPTRGDLDNHCGMCPMVTVVCPALGQVSVFTGPWDTAAGGSSYTPAAMPL